MGHFDFEFEGSEYQYDHDHDLTLSAIRKIKDWYPHLGSYQRFFDGIREGDPEAFVCMIWVARRKTNPNAPEPQSTADFALGDFMSHMKWVSDDAVEEAPNPLDSQGDDLTHD